MNMHTKISSRGQVVIPKDVRDRLKLDIGTQLEVIEQDDAVTFRRVGERKSKSFEDCEAAIRSVVSSVGTRGEVEDWHYAIAAKFEKSPDDSAL